MRSKRGRLDGGSPRDHHALSETILDNAMLKDIASNK